MHSIQLREACSGAADADGLGLANGGQLTPPPVPAMTHQPAASNDWAATQSESRPAALMQACEALREIGAMFCTLRLTAKLAPAVRDLKSHHVGPL